MEIQRDLSVGMTVDLNVIAMEQQSIAFSRKMIAPQAALIADNEIDAVIVPDPGKASRFVEPDSLLAERNFARLENNPENYIAQRSRQQRADARGYSRVRVHQSGNENARDNSRDGAANC